MAKDSETKLEVLNFNEWWMAYNENHNHTIGGTEWLASFAAWHFCLVMTKQKLEQPATNFVPQMEAATKMTLKLSCPCCGSAELKLLRTFGQVRNYRCNKCEQELDVS